MNYLKNVREMDFTPVHGFLLKAWFKDSKLGDSTRDGAILGKALICEDTIIFIDKNGKFRAIAWDKE